MEEKNYEWIENKTTRILLLLGQIFGLIGIIGMILIFILSFFTKINIVLGLYSGIFGYISALVLPQVGIIFSTKLKYTKVFLQSVENRANNAKSKEDLIELYKYMTYQSKENGSYRLSRLQELDNMFIKIEAQIDILKRFEVNEV
jgi:hypothetical protein